MFLYKILILLYRGNQKTTMPKNKTDNRTVETKMDDKLDIQTNIISGIK